MKKILFILLAMVVIVGCKKNDETYSVEDEFKYENFNVTAEYIRTHNFKIVDIREYNYTTGNNGEKTLVVGWKLQGMKNSVNPDNAFIIIDNAVVSYEGHTYVLGDIIPGQLILDLKLIK